MCFCSLATIETVALFVFNTEKELSFAVRCVCLLFFRITLFFVVSTTFSQCVAVYFILVDTFLRFHRIVFILSLRSSIIIFVYVMSTEK